MNPAFVERRRPSLLILGHDILHNICQIIQSSKYSKYPRPLDALCRTCKALKEISMPIIYREIIIDSPWVKAEERICGLQNLPALAQYTRAFTFDVKEIYRGNEPPERVARMLAKLLSQIPNLHKLILSVAANVATVFATAFGDTGLILPEVKILVLGEHCQSVLPTMPNVSTVASNGLQFFNNLSYSEHILNFITAASKVNTLKRLEISIQWKEPWVKAVVEELPNLEFLALDGIHLRVNLVKILKHVKSMPHLQTLCLPRAGELGLGFDGGPKCGNAYMGPDGAKLRERISKQHGETAKKAAAMVLEAFGSDTAPVNLWVGRNHRFELVRGENGMGVEYVHHIGTREKVVKNYFY